MDNIAFSLTDINGNRVLTTVDLPSGTYLPGTIDTNSFTVDPSITDIWIGNTKIKDGEIQASHLTFKITNGFVNYQLYNNIFTINAYSTGSSTDSSEFRCSSTGIILCKSTFAVNLQTPTVNVQGSLRTQTGSISSATKIYKNGPSDLSNIDDTEVLNYGELKSTFIKSNDSTLFSPKGPNEDNITYIWAAYNTYHNRPDTLENLDNSSTFVGVNPRNIIFQEAKTSKITISSYLGTNTFLFAQNSFADQDYSFKNTTISISDEPLDQAESIDTTKADINIFTKASKGGATAISIPTNIYKDGNTEEDKILTTKENKEIFMSKPTIVSDLATLQSLTESTIGTYYILSSPNNGGYINSLYVALGTNGFPSMVKLGEYTQPPSGSGNSI